ncbi:MAG TPA: hypothetical protein VGJ08_07155 [Rhizomicrobium sp.]
MTASCGQYRAEIVVRDSVFRLMVDGGLDPAQRFIPAAAFAAQQAKVLQCTEMCRVEPNNQSIELLGFEQPALSMQPHGHVEGLRRSERFPVPARNLSLHHRRHSPLSSRVFLSPRA